MNLLKISNSIYRCEFPNEHELNGVMMKINIWLVVNQDDVYIIDTGFDYMTVEIIPFVKAIGNPKALFVTHGHVDHISGVHQLVKQFDIPVYAERLEVDAIGRGLVPYPNKKNQLVNYFKEFDDSVLEKAGLKAYVTPGYSPGHTIFHHEKDNVLIVGDLFTTTEKQLLPPIATFTPDMTESIDSGSIIDVLKPNLISSSHGEDIDYKTDLYKQFVLLFRGF